MKKLFIILLSALSLTAVAQSSTETIQIPKWFMHPTADTYVGISVPGGSAFDAICMAWLQYLLAHNIPCTYTPKGVASSWAVDGVDTYTEESQYVFSFAKYALHYRILNIQLLPSGEYICQLKEDTHATSILSGKIYSESYSKMIGSDKHESSMQVSMELTDSIHFCSFKSSWSETLDNYSFDTQYSSVDMAYLTRTYYEADAEHKHEVAYSFPQTENIDEKEATYVDVNSPLATSLMQVYVNLLVSNFVDNLNSQTNQKIRRATPIVGFSIEGGLLKVSYK